MDEIGSRIAEMANLKALDHGLRIFYTTGTPREMLIGPTTRASAKLMQLILGMSELKTEIEKTEGPFDMTTQEFFDELEKRN